MNIEDYEFIDMAKPKVVSANEVAISLEVKHTPWVALFKDDIIAMAKHFDLTVNDLLE